MVLSHLSQREPLEAQKAEALESWLASSCDGMVFVALQLLCKLSP